MTTVPDLAARAAAGERLVVVTAYDYPTARLAARAGVDAIMVGDSLGMVVQGRRDTLGVTLDQMVYHCEMVRRGAPEAVVIGDLPFMSYQASPAQAVASAGRLVQEGGVATVKLEGGERMAEQIRAIVRADIPVMAHIGLTPQSIHRLGGYRVQRDRERLLADAAAVAEAGAWAVVLECIPQRLAAEITGRLAIPTIGIGAGPACGGQVLVLHDLLGLTEGEPLRFVKRYAELGATALEALGRFAAEVRGGTFPTPDHGFGPPPEDGEAGG
ncbi:MAG: 3-methyl-2-oxobutanoate hydroxymethyltransferase [Nitrospirae bacterium]|nr:MAG: 3-methyl-2-oxobutanoate hydroxymethyltransferase [Nitrospirota bacterium]